jgi:predicted ABC-class ATPase
MRTVKEEQLQKDVKVWKSRAEAHEENYLQMLKRIDDVIAERDEATRSCHIWQKGHSDIVAERDLWKLEATRWRDMYLEYDEMLEGQVQEAVDRLNKVWEDLDKLKKKVQDDLRED